MKSKCHPTLVALTLLATGLPALGQQVFFANGAPPADRTATHKKSLEREIAFLIGDMKRACDLSEAQVKKLKVAGKGAIVSAMEKFKKQQKEMQRAIRAAGVVAPGLVEEEPVDEAEDDGDDDADDEENELEDALPFAPPLPFFNFAQRGGNQNKPVTTEPRWTKAVQTVVTKEQQEKYAAAKKSREARVRKAAVAAFIAKVDRKLLLSEKQHASLTAVVDKEFGAKLVKRIGRQNQGMMWLAATTTARGRAPIAYKKLRSVLSEDQLSEWKTTFEAELRQLGQQAGVGGMVGNVIINAAPVAAPIRIQRVVPPQRNDQ